MLVPFNLGRGFSLLNKKLRDILNGGLDGYNLANVAAGDLVLGVPGFIHVLADQAGGASKDLITTHKIKVLNVLAINKAAGGAADGVTVGNAANAITNLIDMNAVDATAKWATTIDDAFNVIAAGGTLRVTKANGANDQNEDVYILAVRSA